MVHGLDAVETETPGGVRLRTPPGRSAGCSRRVNCHHRDRSSVALVAAACVLTYSVASRYFLHFSTDWQDELSVFLIVGAVFMSAAAIQARARSCRDRSRSWACCRRA